MTYDANVITAARKANVCLFNDNRKTEERFLCASHVASGNASPSKLRLARQMSVCLSEFLTASCDRGLAKLSCLLGFVLKCLKMTMFNP